MSKTRQIYKEGKRFLKESGIKLVKSNTIGYDPVQKILHWNRDLALSTARNYGLTTSEGKKILPVIFTHEIAEARTAIISGKTFSSFGTHIDKSIIEKEMETAAHLGQETFEIMSKFRLKEASKNINRTRPSLHTEAIAERMTEKWKPGGISKYEIQWENRLAQQEYLDEVVKIINQRKVIQQTTHKKAIIDLTTNALRPGRGHTKKTGKIIQ
jgi:hypothetical protein